MERFGERAIAVSSQHKSDITCLLDILCSRFFGHLSVFSMTCSGNNLTKYSETYLNRIPYIPETWTNGK